MWNIKEGNKSSLKDDRIDKSFLTITKYNQTTKVKEDESIL